VVLLLLLPLPVCRDVQDFSKQPAADGVSNCFHLIGAVLPAAVAAVPPAPADATATAAASYQGCARLQQAAGS
jgi:hypothetical protein